MPSLIFNLITTNVFKNENFTIDLILYCVSHTCIVCAVFISAPNQVPPLEGAEEENGATNNAGKSKMAVKLSGLLELLMHS